MRLLITRYKPKAQCRDTQTSGNCVPKGRDIYTTTPLQILTFQFLPFTFQFFFYPIYPLYQIYIYPPHITHSPHNPLPPIHPTIPPTAPTVPKKQPPCTVTVQRGKLVFHLTKSEIWNSNCHDKCEVCNYHLFGGQIRQHRNLLWNINLCLLSPVNYTIILQ